MAGSEALFFNLATGQDEDLNIIQELILQQSSRIFWIQTRTINQIRKDLKLIFICFYKKPVQIPVLFTPSYYIVKIR
jgi:hypothetical protein